MAFYYSYCLKYSLNFSEALDKNSFYFLFSELFYEGLEITFVGLEIAYYFSVKFSIRFYIFIFSLLY